MGLHVARKSSGSRIPKLWGNSIPLMMKEDLAPQPLPDPKNFEADPMGFPRKCHKTYIQDRAHAPIFYFDDKLVTLHHQSVCDNLSGRATGGSQLYARDCDSRLYAPSAAYSFLGAPHDLRN